MSSTTDAEREGRGQQRSDPARSRVSLSAALLGFFVVTLDAFVVNVALPDIGRTLHSGVSGLLWVIDGYTLSFAALLLFAGTLADRIGARQAFALGMALFVLASAACGLAPTLAVLIGWRLLQGVGAALLLPASLALIRAAYPDPVARARAIAVWAVGGAVASATGPVVGGLLMLISWRSIFYINLPVGLLVLALLTRVAPSPRRDTPFDWTGQVSGALGIASLTYGLIGGGALGFSSGPVVTALVTAALSTAVFFVAQVRGQHPMVPLSLFRSRPVTISVLAGFAFTVSFYGLVFLFSLFFQQVRGLSPLATGLAFVPMTALSIFINPLSARLVERLGPRWPIAGGQLLMILGLVSLALAAPHAPAALLSALTIPVGVGSALSVPPVTALLVGSVPAERAGVASGVLNTSRQMGGVLSVAVFGLLVAQRATFLHGLQVSLGIAAAVMLASVLASLRLPGRPEQPGAGAPVGTPHD